MSHYNINALRPLLTDAGATEVLEAIAVHDTALTLRHRLVLDSNATHEASHVARARHHDACVHDLLAGRTPDDGRLWEEVVVADAEVERATAVVAAASDAVKRASIGIDAALAAPSCWPAVLPYLARTRHQHTPAWQTLAKVVEWPKLYWAPAIDHDAVTPRYSRFWPLHPGDTDSMHYFRPERKAFNEWAWTEIAAQRFDTLRPDAIKFQQQWTPERYSRFVGAGKEQQIKPIVFLDLDGTVVGRAA